MAHPDRYFKNSPEFFGYSRLTGKREPETLCLTNPELLETAVGNLKKRLKAFRETPDLFTIGFRDSWTMCQCEKCLAPVKTPDGMTITKEDPAFRSTQYFLFLNEVMQKINAEFPDWKIKTLAYFSTAVPPKCEVNANIIPEFAPYVRSNDKVPLFAPENVKWLEYLKEWAEKSKDKKRIFL